MLFPIPPHPICFLIDSDDPNPQPAALSIHVCHLPLNYTHQKNKTECRKKSKLGATGRVGTNKELLPLYTKYKGEEEGRERERERERVFANG